MVSISVSQYQTSWVREEILRLKKDFFLSNTKERICRSQKQCCRTTPHFFSLGIQRCIPQLTLFSHAGIKERRLDDHQHGLPEFSGTHRAVGSTRNHRRQNMSSLPKNIYSYLKASSLFGEQQKCCYKQSGLSRSNFGIGTFSVVTDCKREKSARKILMPHL